MKSTPFTHIHEKLGARMAEFAGFNMPISYSGINDEHETVRKGAGMFDISHMGEFDVKGPHAKELLQKITTNDVSKLAAGKAQYNCMLNDNGGIIDDLVIYCLEENNHYLMVVNAANIEKDWQWVSSHNDLGAELENISDKICLLAIQGPEANKLLQPLTDVDILNLKYYTFQKGTFAGVKDVIVSATGYTGSGGIEIYFENKDGAPEKIWDAVTEAGKEANLKPIGLGARDTLRLEMGYCLYGNDIDDTTSPLEAGLGWITKINKGDFIGKEKVEKIKADGITRKLVGMELLDRGVARHGYEICNNEKEVIGYVTSGTQAPSLHKPIAMGYVTIANSKPDTEIFIKVRDKYLKAKVVKMPFE
ncbi:MAG: glycine cleavage system aminomethyltransferase GcvT [Chitinophagaceae bacterium]|nr:glycine cleavage system aminomethyltransferase GcvT [Chitinophagaceae bacterium]